MGGDVIPSHFGVIYISVKEDTKIILKGCTFCGMESIGELCFILGWWYTIRVLRLLYSYLICNWSEGRCQKHPEGGTLNEGGQRIFIKNGGSPLSGWLNIMEPPIQQEIELGIQWNEQVDLRSIFGEVKSEQECMFKNRGYNA